MLAGRTAQIATHHGYAVVKSNGRSKVRINEPFAVPLCHQGNILFVSLGQGTILYNAIFYIEYAALCRIAHAKIKRSIKRIILANPRVSQS